MKFAAPRAQQMGVRTIFNLLGPLTNPAGASCQLIGVFKPELTEMFAHVLHALGSRRVLVVHGSDGMDEITLTGPTRCAELKDGAVRTYDIDPVRTRRHLQRGGARGRHPRRKRRHHPRHPRRRDHRPQARHRADQRRRLAPRRRQG